MNNFEKFYNDQRKKLENIDAIEDRTIIHNTANELESYNYSPPFLTDIAEFELLGKETALKVLDKLKNNNISAFKNVSSALDLSIEETRMKAIQIFVNEFELLQRLRKNEPAAWDHITELYEDD